MISLANHNNLREKKPDQGSEMIYRIATTYEERTAAFRLVYDSYCRKGLIEPNKTRLRITPYHLLPTTNVFVGIRFGQVVCTVTLIGDGHLGLPMESIYSQEIQRARQQGLYVGEVSGLAVRQNHVKSFLRVFIGMTRLMAQYSRSMGMQQFLIAIHPQHARFYQKFMGFEQIGPQRSYPNVRNALAAAYCLDFARIDQERPACYNEFFGTAISDEELYPRPISCEELELMRPATEFARESIPVMA